MKPLLVLRPEPGASKTAAKARARGLDARVHPLFEVRPLSWSVDHTTPYDALFITSANALIFNEIQIADLIDLPVLCVGQATADAARSSGLSDVIAGGGDAQSLADLAASLGYRHLLWLAGQPSGAIDHPDLIFDVKYLYETPQLDWSEELKALVDAPVIALLHSPRAAKRFAELVPDKAKIKIIAISEKAAMAAGPGWAGVHWPSAPSDDAMLELAAPLCRKG